MALVKAAARGRAVPAMGNAQTHWGRAPQAAGGWRWTLPARIEPAELCTNLRRELSCADSNPGITAITAAGRDGGVGPRAPLLGWQDVRGVPPPLRGLFPTAPGTCE